MNKNRRRKVSRRDPERQEGSNKKFENGTSYPEQPGKNDISWYNKNPELLVAAGSLPFINRPGMFVPTSDDRTKGIKIPGVLTINWAPYAGLGLTPMEPINIAAREVFDRVRSAFSGTLLADSPDFMVYFLSLDSIFSYISALKRIYRIIDMYSPNNLDLPYQMMANLGFTKDEVNNLRLQRVQMWQQINELIHMTDKFKCPKLFPLFDRHYWMNDNAYADADSPMAQLYVFNQIYYLKYTLFTEETIATGGLTYVEAPWATTRTTPLNSGTLFSFGQELINALGGPDETYTISGYLKRAFEGVPDFYVDLLRQDEEFQPVYNVEVLSQIENAYTVVGEGFSVSLTTIKQDPSTNTLQNKVTWSRDLTKRPVNPLPMINIHADMPGVAEVVEASRLITAYDTDASRVLVTGTEIVLWFSVSRLNNQEGVIYPFYSVITHGQGVNDADIINLLTTLEAFDWHPTVHICNLYDDDVALPFMDIYNLTTLSYHDLANLNRICLYSELNAFS